MSFNEKTASTRTALLELKEQRNIASTGLEILKDKEDALVSEFIKTLKRSGNIRSELSLNMTKGREALLQAEEWLGASRTQQLALSCTPVENITIEKKAVMGVSIPKIKTGKLKKNILERGYNLHDSCESVDTASDFFEYALQNAILAGELETGTLVMGEEITKTRTKSNALEKIIIPGILMDEKKVKFKINEKEREDVSKLKRIKKTLKR